ncbi:VOC family protein [Flavitalea sp.]|nr:VOC family protein [Flavitalea sp.]
MATYAKYKVKKMSPQLLVADIKNSIEFYKKILNFDLDFQYEQFYAGMSQGNCSIHLKSGSSSIEERKNRNNKEDLDLVFSVDGIEDLYQELSNKNIEILQPLRNMPYGKEFYIADPDGYIIGFITEA